ncbi:hypothetical protein D3C78_1301410 [compost metagenome]
MSSAYQYTATLRDQGKNMPGLNYVCGARIGRCCNLNGQRPIRCGDPCGDPCSSLD